MPNKTKVGPLKVKKPKGVLLPGRFVCQLAIRLVKGVPVISVISAKPVK